MLQQKPGQPEQGLKPPLLLPLPLLPLLLPLFPPPLLLPPLLKRPKASKPLEASLYGAPASPPCPWVVYEHPEVALAATTPPNARDVTMAKAGSRMSVLSPIPNTTGAWDLRVQNCHRATTEVGPV